MFKMRETLFIEIVLCYVSAGGISIVLTSRFTRQTDAVRWDGEKALDSVDIQHFDSNRES